jgi:malto-oligosyltrehalose trehalohydrolase
MTIELEAPNDTPIVLPSSDVRPAYRFGPLVKGDDTIFRLWAPTARSAHLILENRDPLSLQRVADGFLQATVRGVGSGTRYRFRIGDLFFPDLASRQQDGDTSGWSLVREPFEPSLRSLPLRPWHETIICEVHIGTVSPEGTFAGLMNRLEHFRDAGYTALEIMPVNEFPGTRNWGYDGTLIFAPESSYGTPEDLRALVDRAHELGLSLILDVVYNHFGEVDNFVEQYAPEWFNSAEKTPWGPAINLVEPMVRRFYYENARMWLSEYDFDGLRFDSVHEIKGDSRSKFLGELAEEACEAKPFAKLVIENMDNSFRWLERNESNQPMTYVAQWNDDMHHVLDFVVTGDGRKTGYDEPGKDAYADLEKALTDGFVHDPTEGQQSDGHTRGGSACLLPPDSFITYIQNHDQIGNRSDATRIPDRTSPAQVDFAHFVKMLAPQIPLCFMGDEGNLRSGFPFFVDLEGQAAKAKRDRRYKEMREMFKEPDVKDGDLPDPSSRYTFDSAKLPWEAYYREEHRSSIERFRQLARFRREMVWPLTATPCLDARSARHGNCLIVTWEFEVGSLSMALNPTGAPADCGCLICTHPVSTGEWSQHGDVLRLGAWTAVAWTSAPR